MKTSFFLSLDFQELWRSMRSILSFTEVKRQCAMLGTGMGDRFSALLISLMALQIVPVD